MVFFIVLYLSRNKKLKGEDAVAFGFATGGGGEGYNN
jgi:hypothetical protein